MSAHHDAVVDSAAILDAEHAAVLGFPPREYASLFVTRSDGQRLTLIGPDVDWLRMLTASPAHVIDGLALPPEKFPLVIAGWPEDWGLFYFTVDSEPEG